MFEVRFPQCMPYPVLSVCSDVCFYWLYVWSSSTLLMVSVFAIPRMLLRHLFIKMWIDFIDDGVSLHISDWYSIDFKLVLIKYSDSYAYSECPASSVVSVVLAWQKLAEPSFSLPWCIHHATWFTENTSLVCELFYVIKFVYSDVCHSMVCSMT
jgi:hypothetical protein